MKYLILIFTIFFMSGCLYFNQSGVSTKLYSQCKEYYDAEGNYVKECPANLADYSELDN